MNTGSRIIFTAGFPSLVMIDPRPPMSRFFATPNLFLLALFTTSAAAQETELSADQIIQKHVAALGGADKLGAIQNVTMTGQASLMDGQFQAPVTVRAKRPASMRMR